MSRLKAGANSRGLSEAGLDRFIAINVELDPASLRPGVLQLLRLRLHVVRYYQPTAIKFFIDIRYKGVDLDLVAVLEFRRPSLLGHLPRQIAIHVNMGI